MLFFCEVYPISMDWSVQFAFSCTFQHTYDFSRFSFREEKFQICDKLRVFIEESKDYIPMQTKRCVNSICRNLDDNCVSNNYSLTVPSVHI